MYHSWSVSPGWHAPLQASGHQWMSSKDDILIQLVRTFSDVCCWAISVHAGCPSNVLLCPVKYHTSHPAATRHSLPLTRIYSSDWQIFLDLDIFKNTWQSLYTFFLFDLFLISLLHRLKSFAFSQVPWQRLQVLLTPGDTWWPIIPFLQC